MHIGNARTALFNWLFARANGGKFLLRIEDTDRARHSEEAVDAIIRGLQWLDLQWDGEVVSQFARADRHREVAEELLAKGKAYKCYCSPEELEIMREEAVKEGRPTAYDKRWRDRDPSEAPAGIKPVIRIKAPLTGETIIEDEVQGKVTVKNEQIDDFILLRADGNPTYMLAVVVDDHDMGVTHVMRGDDHLNNAFRQKVIIDAMDWPVPTYAHLPLIHGPDGKKFSKRHGAEGLEDYKNMGYLPEAMFNFLLKMGWNHGDDEIISREQALKLFGIKGMGKSAAKFDIAKLDHLNAHYIAQMSAEELLNKATPFFDSPLDDTAKSRITTGIKELKERSKTLVNFAHEAEIYIRQPDASSDEKALQMINDGKDILKTLLKKFESMDTFDKETVMAACKAIADMHAEGKLGKIGMPLRAALTGRTSSPGIFDVAAIIGKEETCLRIKKALS
jgi:glutamyl-tRNA synthetase